MHKGRFWLAFIVLTLCQPLTGLLIEDGNAVVEVDPKDPTGPMKVTVDGVVFEGQWSWRLAGLNEECDPAGESLMQFEPLNQNWVRAINRPNQAHLRGPDQPDPYLFDLKMTLEGGEVGSGKATLVSTLEIQMSAANPEGAWLGVLNTGFLDGGANESVIAGGSFTFAEPSRGREGALTMVQDGTQCSVEISIEPMVKHWRVYNRNRKVPLFEKPRVWIEDENEHQVAWENPDQTHGTWKTVHPAAIGTPEFALYWECTDWKRWGKRTFTQTLTFTVDPELANLAAKEEAVVVSTHVSKDEVIVVSEDQVLKEPKKPETVSAQRGLWEWVQTGWRSMWKEENPPDQAQREAQLKREPQ